jgi:hypothetical protein
LGTRDKNKKNPSPSTTSKRKKLSAAEPSGHSEPLVGVAPAHSEGWLLSGQETVLC